MKDALIVIDMQNDFITGSLGTPEARRIVKNVVKKIEAYKEKGKDIYFTKDTHVGEDYFETREGMLLPIKHCIYGTDGHNLEPSVRELIKYYGTCFNKASFGYMNWKHLKIHDSVEVIGLCTDICVISNVLIMQSENPDLDITVDASCCAGTTPSKHMAALDVMESCLIEVINRHDTCIELDYSEVYGKPYDDYILRQSAIDLLLSEPGSYDWQINGMINIPSVKEE